MQKPSGTARDPAKMLKISSFRLGSPLSSPKLNGQLRNAIPVPPTQVRRWLGAAAVCLAFLFILHVGVPGRPGEPHPHVQAVQNILIHPAQSLPFDSSSDYHKPRERLQRPRADFPPKIWQTWKVDPLRFEQRDLEKARSWTEKNPDWRYEVLTDGNDIRYVEFHYGPEGFNRPDIVAFYRDVKAAIIKADLLRYLIMYAEGGVYADIDVEAMKPMSKFIPERYDHKDIDMVIGIEIDEPEWKDHPILGPKSRSFCQWTFMSKPEMPVMLRLVENIMGWLMNLAQNQTVPLGEVELDFDEVISGTGPSAFTNAIIGQMNQDRLASGEPDVRKSPEITWDMFHDMDESKIVGRVLVLNVEAFAAGQGHSNSGTHDTRHSLVKHHYHASNWPSRHPRFRHPAYGQVEDCNWNRDCVHKWDDDVATFKTLSEEEQKKIVAVKEKEREEKEAEEKRKKEEAEAKKKEEEERRRVEEEERRKKEGEPPAEKDAPEREPVERPEGEERRPEDPPSSKASVLFSTLFGYAVFLCVCLYVVWKSGCIRPRQASYVDSIPSKV